MRSAQISFIHKKVWIIGGGSQAFKKGRAFVEEGAKVSFVSLDFCQELMEYAQSQECSLIQQPYNIEEIEQGFLIYACTNHVELNHQIVEDANHKGMLSASVHRDMNATYHPLQFVDYPNLHVAVSTNGAAPAYNREILLEFHRAYEEVHHEKLEQLRIERQKRLVMKN